MNKHCPCCKITRTLNEYLKHPSITSFKSLENSLVEFNNNHPEKNVELIVACDHHSKPGILDNWWDNIMKDAKNVMEKGHVVRRLVHR